MKSLQDLINLEIICNVSSLPYGTMKQINNKQKKKGLLKIFSYLGFASHPRVIYFSSALEVDSENQNFECRFPTSFSTEKIGSIKYSC